MKETYSGNKLPIHLVIIVGLPGTGKTTLTNMLAATLPSCAVIESNAVRRSFKVPETKELQRATDRYILETINQMTSEYLSKGKIVILDSLHRFAYRRQELYSIAAAHSLPALALECICSEKEAKRRMQMRPESDGLISDPTDTSMYDRFLREWEPVSTDFSEMPLSHVGYVQYESEHRTFKEKILRDQTRPFITALEKAIKSYDLLYSRKSPC